MVSGIDQTLDPFYEEASKAIEGRMKWIQGRYLDEYCESKE
jgi:beta-N-acetylglucosaminidase